MSWDGSGSAARADLLFDTGQEGFTGFHKAWGFSRLKGLGSIIGFKGWGLQGFAGFGVVSGVCGGLQLSIYIYTSSQKPWIQWILGPRDLCIAKSTKHSMHWT